jgi:hypothetical protein
MARAAADNHICEIPTSHKKSSADCKNYQKGQELKICVLSTESSEIKYS